MTESVKAVGRTLAYFKQLSSAEEKLLEACKQGVVAEISKERPAAATDINTVRAGFLRFLALGGDEKNPVHEHGVQLQGAWVEGALDLQDARIPHSLYLRRCHFSDMSGLLDSRIHGTLSLEGSYINGLAADRMVCDGGVFLRRGFTANGGVRLLGAQIGGNLECSGAKLDGKGSDALSFDGAVIKGSVFLTDSIAVDGSKTGFTASGVIRLLGAQIGGDLDCSGAKLDGKDGNALLCDGANVADTFLFRELAHAVNGVSLTSMRVRTLADDSQAWGERLNLGGFVYGELAGGAPTNAVARLAWLDKQPPSHSGRNGDGADFRPQPWQQLIRVLRHMGHSEDARQVAIAFEHRLRRANLIGQATQRWYRLDSWFYRHVCRIFHCLYGLLIGYGYRPLRTLFLMLIVWLACGIFYWYAALDGVFAPSDPLVFQNPKYQTCTAECVGNWYLCATLPEEYTGFSPLAYSLDVILPLVDLQQETDWAPLIPTPKSVWYQELLAFDIKQRARLVVWFEILFGWVASLLLVAVVSGLTKRREE